MPFDARDSPARSRRLAVTLTAAVLAAVAAGETEAANTCPPAEEPPTVILNPSPGRVTYSREYDVAGLAALRRQSGHKVTGRGAAVGLTQASLAFQMSLGVKYRPDGSGRGCAYLGSVKVTLGYDTIDVFLARDYPTNSCAYGAIRDHENRHVAVFRDNLAEYSQVIRKALVEEASRQGPLRATDADAAGAEFQKRLMNRLRPLYDNMVRTGERNQMALDTPAAYARDQARCTDW